MDPLDSKVDFLNLTLPTKNPFLAYFVAKRATFWQIWGDVSHPCILTVAPPPKKNFFVLFCFCFFVAGHTYNSSKGTHNIHLYQFFFLRGPGGPHKNCNLGFVNLKHVSCIHGCLKQLFIEYFDKNVILYFTRSWKPSKVIKCVELPRFQPILKLSVTSVESLFTLKLFISDLYKFRFVTK